MNKEVIKKYKDVFDWWLNGGKVWVYNTERKEWSLETNLIWDCSDCKYVQDDRYAEFRKALADGKRIQYKHKGAPYNYAWMEFSIKDYTNYMFETKYIYRIKPDEPKFKVGDWVIESGSKRIGQITFNDGRFLSIKDGTSNDYRQYAHCWISLWQPKVGEWVWYRTLDYGTPTIFKVTEHHLLHEDLSGCEPFMGILPSFISEINKG